MANKARDGVRDLEKEAPNYTTFNMAADGKLTPVPGSSVGRSPDRADRVRGGAGQGGVAFGLEDGGPIRGFSIDERAC